MAKKALKILIVDDDVNICELLRLYVEREGFVGVVANDGREAIGVFINEKPDIVLLDLMLPSIDGLTVCKELKKIRDGIPVIFLTAKDDVFEKVLGLELGADDYIVKPFDAKEVIARIRAVLRRTKGNIDAEIHQVLELDRITVDLTNYELRIDGKKTNSPPKEIELLHFLIKNKNRTVSREQLINNVWGYEYYGDTRTIDVHIKRLREKINGISPNWHLKTIWGVGYKFEVRK